MNEYTNELEMVDDAILPDGWTESADIFDETTWGATDTQVDAPAVVEDPGVDTGLEEPSETIPTTESEPSDGDPAPSADAAPTTESAQDPTDGARKLKFTARVDRRDFDVEVDESELPTLYQKAQVTDRLRNKLDQNTAFINKAENLARAMGYENAEAMLEAAGSNYRTNEVDRLVGEGVHKEIAEDMVQRKFSAKAAVDASEKKTEAPVETAPEQKVQGRDFKAEVAELLTARPELRNVRIPDEVARACAIEGKPLVTAYSEYEAKQAKAEAQRLRKENRTLHQNQAAAAKAPVRGVSGSGPIESAEDDFLKGFNSDY